MIEQQQVGRYLVAAEEDEAGGWAAGRAAQAQRYAQPGRRAAARWRMRSRDSWPSTKRVSIS